MENHTSLQWWNKLTLRKKWELFFKYNLAIAEASSNIGLNINDIENTHIREIWEAENIITEQEILSLHEKITFCYIENPHPEESDEYYVKIRFYYKMNYCEIPTDGWQEFVNTNKEQIIAYITEFMESEKKSWKIV